MARHMLSLFGLAPDGVYLARDVTSAAVRSYRTLSSLPSSFFAKRKLNEAVSFLWHCPSARAGRELPAFVEPGLSSNTTL